MDLSSYLNLFVAEAREHIGAASGLASNMDAPTTGQTASMHALSASAHELARTSDQMKSLIATFRLRD